MRWRCKMPQRAPSISHSESRGVARKSPDTRSPGTRWSRRIAARVSLPRQRRAPADRQKKHDGEGEKTKKKQNKTRACSTCALNRAVCAFGRVCEDAELPICGCNQESEAGRSNASGRGYKNRGSRRLAISKPARSSVSAPRFYLAAAAPQAHPSPFAVCSKSSALINLIADVRTASCHANAKPSILPQKNSS